MRRWIVGLTVLGTLIGLTGCQTVTRTKEESKAKYNRQITLMLRQMGDDGDYLLLANRQSRLSKFHTR